MASEIVTGLQKIRRNLPAELPAGARKAFLSDLATVEAKAQSIFTLLDTCAPEPAAA